MRGAGRVDANIKLQARGQRVIAYRGVGIQRLGICRQHTNLLQTANDAYICIRTLS